jgi:hypothetical protein
MNKKKFDESYLITTSMLLALGVVILFALALVIVALYPQMGVGMTGFATAQVGNLTASVATYISCTWSDEALAVSFGSNLNPGTNDINATNNYAGVGNGTSYNVTVDTLSNVKANVTVKGADLISGVNAIAVGNVTWQSNSTAANGTNMVPTGSIALTTAYDTTNKIASNLAIGSTSHYRYWIDIPSGQVAGSYVGNYTMQCQQA